MKLSMHLEEGPFSPPIPEPQNEAPKSPEIPEEFFRLRDKVNALASEPLEERFSEEELTRILTPPEEYQQNFKKKFLAENGKAPDGEDFEDFKKKYAQNKTRSLQDEISEVELMKLLEEQDMLIQTPGNNDAQTVFDKNFACDKRSWIELA